MAEAMPAIEHTQRSPRCRGRSALLVVRSRSLMVAGLLPFLLAACADWFRSPAFQISIVRQGTTVEDVERLLIKPMEAELGKIERVQELRSVARPDRATMIVVFEPGSDPRPAAAMVVKTVEQTRTKLPIDVNEPEITDVTGANAN